MHAEIRLRNVTAPQTDIAIVEDGRLSRGHAGVGLRHLNVQAGITVGFYAAPDQPGTVPDLDMKVVPLGSP